MPCLKRYCNAIATAPPLNMRAHELLHWIAPTHTPLNGAAWEIHHIFGSNKLLPVSVEADVEKQDVRTWAALCFAVWTQSDQRKPHHVDQWLNGDGIEAWTEPENGNFIEWLATTVCNWPAATNVANITVNLSRQFIEVTLNTGKALTFRNVQAANAGYQDNSIQDVRTISNTATNAGGGVVLWHLAGHFTGMSGCDYTTEPAPRGDVNPLRVVGNKYRK